MFCAADDFMNAQCGNNNPWNQDNETTWLSSDLLKENGDIFRFFRQMIAFRRAHPSPSRSRFWREDVVGTAQPARQIGPSLAFCVRRQSQKDQDIYVMINASWEDLNFTVQGKAGEWLCAADRALASPADFCDAGHEKKVNSLNYNVKARSVVVLLRAR
jgi:isoamylase